MSHIFAFYNIKTNKLKFADVLQMIFQEFIAEKVILNVAYFTEGSGYQHNKRSGMDNK